MKCSGQGANRVLRREVRDEQQGRRGCNLGDRFPGSVSAVGVSANHGYRCTLLRQAEGGGETYPRIRTSDNDDFPLRWSPILDSISVCHRHLLIFVQYATVAYRYA